MTGTVLQMANKFSLTVLMATPGGPRPQVPQNLIDLYPVMVSNYLSIAWRGKIQPYRWPELVEQHKTESQGASRGGAVCCCDSSQGANHLRVTCQNQKLVFSFYTERAQIGGPVVMPGDSRPRAEVEKPRSKDFQNPYNIGKQLSLDLEIFIPYNLLEKVLT